MAKALEQIYQSSYLNNTYNITSMIPSQLRLHSATFNRLGKSYLSSQTHESLSRALLTSSKAKRRFPNNISISYTTSRAPKPPNQIF